MLHLGFPRCAHYECLTEITGLLPLTLWDLKKRLLPVISQCLSRRCILIFCCCFIFRLTITKWGNWWTKPGWFCPFNYFPATILRSALSLDFCSRNIHIVIILRTKLPRMWLQLQIIMCVNANNNRRTPTLSFKVEVRCTFWKLWLWWTHLV